MLERAAPMATQLAIIILESGADAGNQANVQGNTGAVAMQPPSMMAS
jgi:hypothetical protein